MLSLTLTGATSRGTYLRYLEHQSAIGADTTTAGLILIDTLVPHIQVLGALVAISYGFNAINKERTEGSLKVLLSYPIYRDQIILGKLIAGLLVVSLVTVASLVMALAIYLYFNNISFALDPILRFATFTFLSVLLLSSYLGLSMLFSIAFKEQKTTLLVMFLLIGLFNSRAFSSFGRILSDIVYGPERNPGDPFYPLNPQAWFFRDFIQKLSPSYSYQATSIILRFHSIPTFVGDGYVNIPSNVWSVLIHCQYSIVLLLIIPILTFAASYVLFTRRDIT